MSCQNQTSLFSFCKVNFHLQVDLGAVLCLNPEIWKDVCEACLGDGRPLLTTRVSMEEVVDFSRARPLPRPPCAPPRGRRLPGKLLLRP